MRVPVPHGTSIPPTVGINSEYTSYPEWVPKIDPKTGKPLKKGGRLVREERNATSCSAISSPCAGAVHAGRASSIQRTGAGSPGGELVEASFQAGIDLRRITYRPDPYVGNSIKPTRMVRVVAHEARAELAHLADFNEPADMFSGPLKHEFDAVQKTFATIKSPCLLTPSDRCGHYHDYYISLYDTRALTPTEGKSLAAVAKVFGRKKVDVENVLPWMYLDLEGAPHLSSVKWKGKVAQSCSKPDSTLSRSEGCRFTVKEGWLTTTCSRSERSNGSAPALRTRPVRKVRNRRRRNLSAIF